MNTVILSTLRRTLAVGSAVLFCVSLSACIDEEHFAHHDFVSPVTGDAVAVNQATQTINPWPKEAKDSTINVDGKRLAIGIARYEANKSIPPRGTSTSSAAPQQQQQQSGDFAPPPGSEVQK